MDDSSSWHLVDPQLRPFLALFPKLDLKDSTLASARALLSARFGGTGVAAEELTGTTEVKIAGVGSQPAVRAFVHRPVGGIKKKAGIFHVHGGGYVMGSPDIGIPRDLATVQKHGCVLMAPAYRLAPEHKYPAALEDLWVALKWFHANAHDLGFDPSRIVLLGESAGGGLAAALALLARDRGEIPLAGQVLAYPMLDDRTGSTITPARTSGEFRWTVEMNRFAWSSFLQQAPGADDVPAYAAPARAENLAGLPPTTILVGALDLFVRENIDFAHRLIEAAVPTHLHVYAGAYHGFDLVEDAQVTKAFKRDSADALARLLGSEGKR